MRRFQPTPQWSRIPESLPEKEQIKLLRQRINDILDWIDEVANLPALKDDAPADLTAADATAVNSGDAGTDDVIENLRTKQAEYDALLRGFGLANEA